MARDAVAPGEGGVEDVDGAGDFDDVKVVDQGAFGGDGLGADAGGSRNDIVHGDLGYEAGERCNKRPRTQFIY